MCTAAFNAACNEKLASAKEDPEETYFILRTSHHYLFIHVKYSIFVFIYFVSLLFCMLVRFLCPLPPVVSNQSLENTLLVSHQTLNSRYLIYLGQRIKYHHFFNSCLKEGDWGYMLYKFNISCFQMPMKYYFTNVFLIILNFLTSFKLMAPSCIITFFNDVWS